MISNQGHMKFWHVWLRANTFCRRGKFWRLYGHKNVFGRVKYHLYTTILTAPVLLFHQTFLEPLVQAVSDKRRWNVLDPHLYDAISTCLKKFALFILPGKAERVASLLSAVQNSMNLVQVADFPKQLIATCYTGSFIHQKWVQKLTR